MGGCLLTASAPHGAAAGFDGSTLTLATWNLEWLIAPATFNRLARDCVPEGASSPRSQRRLPCDVVQRFDRSNRDFQALERYASELDADVIALQEVDGAEAARLVFREHSFCFTGRPHVQNTGFAIRRGVPFRCGPDARSLALDDSLRRGAELILFPGEPREIRLLSVHLKSGCRTDALDSRGKACRDLARQTPALESWVDAQARAGRKFGVLGDFNRDLLGEARRADAATPEQAHRWLWTEVNDGDPPGATLVNVAAGQRFRNCVPGQSFTSYIDHIVLSESLAPRVVPGSFRRVTYTATDARRSKLSDHCPVAVQLRVTPP